MEALYNLEIEEALIGSIFMDGELIKDCTIPPEHLYIARLRTIFSIFKSLVDKGKPIDVLSVAEEAGENLENIGGYSYLSALSDSVPSTANFAYYNEKVLQYYQKRKTLEIAQNIQQAAMEHVEIESVLCKGIQDLQRVEDQSSVEDDGDIRKSLIDIYEEFGQDSGEICGIPSGFQTLDYMTGGFQESDLIVIGARPSVGKTAFAINLALQAATEDVAIIFSLEMGKKQLIKRAIGLLGGVNSVKLRNPHRTCTENDWNNIQYATGDLSKLHLNIFDQGGMDVPFIRTQVRKLKRKYGNEKRLLVVIDYLQLIKGDHRLKGNRQAEISEISRELKQIAKEMNVVIIALSQLSRAVESRQNKRPMLSDLRDSGQIEQDADVIAFLYRDDYYDQGSSDRSLIEVILAKQRNGPVGTIKLAFFKEIGKFKELAV